MPGDDSEPVMPGDASGGLLAGDDSGPVRPGDDSGGRLAEALSAFASGVTLVTVSDGRDDIGTTVSAFCPLSLAPPLVLVSLIADSYPAEVLSRVSRFGVTILGVGDRKSTRLNSSH